MAIPPKIVHQWPQGGAAERRERHRTGAEARAGITDGSGLPARPTVKAQFIGFFGTLTNGREIEEQFVQVLAGDGAPTVTGGWPKWVEVERPQRVSMTVLQGYPPLQLTIPIRFEAVLETQGRMDVEREVQKLEWMAGRSRVALGHTHGEPGGVFTGHPGHDALGDSPLIQVYTSDGQKETPLVPVQFQGLNCVMTNIAFDESTDGCKRSAGGARVRQLATVTLLQHVGSPGTSFDSPTVRAAARSNGEGKGRTVSTTAGVSTITKVALQYTHTTRTVGEILKANSHNRKIGSNPDKVLPTGTKVFIPFNALHGTRNG